MPCTSGTLQSLTDSVRADTFKAYLVIGYASMSLLSKLVVENRMAPKTRSPQLKTQESRLLAQIVNNCPVATFVIDAEHHVLHWNRACALITGVTEQQLIGTTDSWKAFYPGKRPG